MSRVSSRDGDGDGVQLDDSLSDRLRLRSDQIRSARLEMTSNQWERPKMLGVWSRDSEMTR